MSKRFETVTVTFTKNRTRKTVTMPGRAYSTNTSTQIYLEGPRGASYCLQIWDSGAWRVYSMRGAMTDIAWGPAVLSQVTITSRKPTAEEIEAGATERL